MPTITSANSIFMLSIATIFPSPIQLQGYGPDDAFDTNQVPVGETQMGVDGLMAGGFVFSPVEQDLTLIASSASITIFDQWYQAMILAKDAYAASGFIQLPGLGAKWTMNNGFLIDYSIVPNAKRVLQPQKFKIRWQSVIKGPL